MTGRADRARSAGLWLRDTGLGAAGYVLVATVAVAGWSASFVGLHQFAVDHMGLDSDPAWLVPVTFDGAALGLTLSVARAAMHGRGALIWRVLVVGFTGLSAWINWVHIADPAGRWVAALLPISAVTVFESLMAEARQAYERRTGRVRPRIHPLRWVFDFGGTWAIVRDFVLDVPLPDRYTDPAGTGPVTPVDAAGTVSAAPGWLPDVLPSRPVPVASVAAETGVRPVMVSATVTPPVARDTTPDATAGATRRATAARHTGDSDTTPDATAKRQPVRQRSDSGSDIEVKARRLLARHPDMTGTELARRLDVSPRTGQRLRRQVTS